MGTHPLNLTLRFLLELTILFAYGNWGWNQGSDWRRYALAIILPFVAAAVWGIFAVPDDPSRSGKAPLPVPGIVRLLLELGIFVLAVWAMLNSGLFWTGLIFALLALIHYLLSYDRIIWLLRGDR
jgi:hypothetical protein